MFVLCINFTKKHVSDLFADLDYASCAKLHAIGTSVLKINVVTVNKIYKCCGSGAVVEFFYKHTTLTIMPISYLHQRFFTT